MFLAFIYIAHYFLTKAGEIPRDRPQHSFTMIQSMTAPTLAYAATMMLTGYAVLYLTTITLGYAAPSLDFFQTAHNTAQSQLHGGLTVAAIYLAVHIPAVTVNGTLRRAHLLGVSIGQATLQAAVVAAETMVAATAALTAGAIIVANATPEGLTSPLLSATIALLLLDFEASRWAVGWWLEERRDGIGLLRQLRERQQQRS